MVWFAPVSLSSPGRSAVSRIKGMLLWLASMTAGIRFATAVPDDVTTTAGLLQRSDQGSAVCDCCEVASNIATCTSCNAERYKSMSRVKWHACLAAQACQLCTFKCFLPFKEQASNPVKVPTGSISENIVQRKRCSKTHPVAFAKPTAQKQRERSSRHGTSLARGC